MTNQPRHEPWPAGGGEMGERVRKHDWASTSLGPLHRWPTSLKTATDLILGCEFPMILLWGTDLTQIYNDGCRAMMANKHPTSLGRPARECWPETWDLHEPIYGRVWRGETVTLHDQMIPTMRHGYREEAYFTSCYSPVRGETGGVAGVLVTVFETTGRLRADEERRQREDALRAEEKRQSFLVRLGDRIRTLADPVEIQRVACQLLGDHLGASHTYYYDYDEKAERGVVRRDYPVAGETSIAGTYRLQDFPFVHSALRGGAPLVLPEVSNAPLGVEESARFERLRLRGYVGVPLVKEGKLVAVLNVCQ
ncbi:MAG TPA: GAF domain-containing protein, partial [Bryobacteraceae bacterium]|nr:GAF domain-containing protein [Bryobacteraceae bacterium]